jgi:hypothetical protein
MAETPTAAAGGVTPVSWAEALLADIGAPVNANTVSTITGWEQAEGGAGPQFGVAGNITNFNPINVSLESKNGVYGYDPGTGVLYPGAQPTPGNNPPIASFTSWSQGLAATAARLEEPFAHSILADLQGNAPESATAAAVASSGWGTGDFGPGPSSGGGTTPATSSATPSTPATSVTTPAATLTGAFGIPGLPSWLDPSTDIGTILQGAENIGLIFLGVIMVIVGLVVLAISAKPSDKDVQETESGSPPVKKSHPIEHAGETAGAVAAAS